MNVRMAEYCVSFIFGGPTNNTFIDFVKYLTREYRNRGKANGYKS